MQQQIAPPDGLQQLNLIQGILNQVVDTEPFPYDPLNSYPREPVQQALPCHPPGTELPTVITANDRVYSQLRFRQGIGGAGTLVHEYPFVYSSCSYLHDLTAVLDQIISALRTHNVPCRTLQAIHLRTQQVLLLLANRLAIIRTAVDLSPAHATQLQSRLYGSSTLPMPTSRAQSEIQKIVDQEFEVHLKQQRKQQANRGTWQRGRGGRTFRGRSRFGRDGSHMDQAGGSSSSQPPRST